jgi:hypothetical protein
MKNCLIVLGLMLGSIYCNAQQLLVNWTDFVSCPNAPGLIKSAIATDDDGIIFTGFSSCTGGGAFPVTPLLKQNIIVGKLNAAKQVVWLKVFGGSEDEQGVAICKTYDGKYIIAATSSSADGDASGHHGLAGSPDVLLIKLDKNGNKIWSKSYGSTDGSEYPWSIIETPEHQYVVSAGTNGSDGDVPFSYGNSAFQMDWFVFKIDGNGNKVWSKTIGGSEDEHTGILILADTNYYLSGSSLSRDHDCTDISWHTGIPSTDYDYFLLKLDTAGNVLWNKSYGGTAMDLLNDATWDEQDTSIVMVGHSYSDDFLGTGKHDRADILILKTDIAGNLKWNKIMGTDQDELDPQIAKGTHNEYAIAANTVQGPIGSQDAILYMLSRNGDLLAEKIFGGIEAEYVSGLCSYDNGYIQVGASGSDTYTEGTSSRRLFPGSGQMAITKIEYFPTGVEDVMIDQLKIYPNPAESNVKIELPGGKGQLMIYSTDGKIVYQHEVKRKDKALDIPITNWMFGIYQVVLNMTNGKKIHSNLIIK